jgi:hypothetical protein
LCGPQCGVERNLLKGFLEMVFSKLFGEALQHWNEILEGKVEDFLKGHVRVFQELVLDGGFCIHED